MQPISCSQRLHFSSVVLISICSCLSSFQYSFVSVHTLSTYVRCNSLSNLTPDENHAITLQFLSLLQQIQHFFPSDQSVDIPSVSKNPTPLTSPSSESLNMHSSIFRSLNELLTSIDPQLRTVLTTCQSSPQSSIDSAVLVNTSEATPREYYRQLLFLRQLIPLLLSHKGFEAIRHHKDALSQLILCTVHFTDHLTTHTFYSDSLSLTRALLNTSLSSQHHACLWRMRVAAATRVCDQSTLLTLIETALKDPLGQLTSSI